MFEDITRLSHKSHNDEGRIIQWRMKKNTKTNNVLQSTTQKTQD